MSNNMVSLPVPKNYKIDKLLQEIKIEEKTTKLESYTCSYVFYVDRKEDKKYQLHKLQCYGNGQIYTCQNEFLAYAFDMVISPDGLYLYIASQKDILKFRISDVKFMSNLNKNVKFEENHPDYSKRFNYYSERIAITSDGKKLYSSSSASQRLVEYDLTVDIEKLEPKLVYNNEKEKFNTGMKSLVICKNYVVMSDDSSFYKYNTSDKINKKVGVKNISAGGIVIGCAKEKNTVYVCQVTKLYLLNLETDQFTELCEFKAYEILSSVLHPTKDIIFIGHSEGLIKLYKSIGDQWEYKPITNGKSYWVWDLRIDGSILYVYYENSIYWYRIDEEEKTNGAVIKANWGRTFAVQPYNNYIEFNQDN